MDDKSPGGLEKKVTFSKVVGQMGKDTGRALLYALKKSPFGAKSAVQATYFFTKGFIREQLAEFCIPTAVRTGFGFMHPESEPEGKKLEATSEGLGYCIGATSNMFTLIYSAGDDQLAYYLGIFWGAKVAGTVLSGVYELSRVGLKEWYKNAKSRLEDNGEGGE